jgi:predicted NAD/FAD-binding protein
MRIAVVGAGISGLACAWLLQRQHDVTLYEAGHYLGGHTNTVDVTLDGVTHPVDTGFLVHNDWTYPNLIALFKALEVATHPSDMSFSVQLEAEQLEWAGTSLSSLFAQRRNLWRPSFWRMISDIVRFNRQAPQLLDNPATASLTLQEVLDQGNYSIAFRDWYLLPMGAAIWSSSTAQILGFPAHSFIRFCLNHGLLSISNRPQWKTVVGGGREYVRTLAAGIGTIHLHTPVQQIERDANGVTVHTAHDSTPFDAIVLATHSDQALALLANPSAAEQSILGAITYAPNRAVLHTDPSFLPQRPGAWAAWNYQAGHGIPGQRPVAVTYLLNQLQPLPFQQPVMVTLNPYREPQARHLLASFDYAHPQFDMGAIRAQQQLASLQGQQQTWFCGAWAGYGFHEDGLKSALRVARALGITPDWQAVYD